MKEYTYHPKYKYYISSNNATESPVDKGTYIISANATVLAPPIVEDKKIQIFDDVNEIWFIVDDLRGAYYNIFNGRSFYNENPLLKPDYSTNIEPPIDYNPDYYIWNQQNNFWQKINSIYRIPESEIENLSITEKLNKLQISPQELKNILEIDDSRLSSVENELKQIQIDLEDFKHNTITEIINAPLEEKFRLLNINLDEIKNLLGITQIINSSLDDKFNLLNIDIDYFKNILGYTELIRKFSECKVEQSLIEYKIQNFMSKIQDLINSTPHNLSNIIEFTILKPQEIIKTSQKFEYDNETLPAVSIGICYDTGERKFGDGITRWNDLPIIPSNQRYRFSRTLERWQTEDPIPGENIECYETDTGKLKVGNGFLSWSKLPYEGG